MTAPVALVRLTTDEIAALCAALDLESLPGVHLEPTFEPEEEDTSASAGLRSLLARGLADIDDEDGALVPGEVLALLVGGLAAARRRLLIVDPGLDGAVATVSVSDTTLVLHRRVSPGVHDVVLTTRESCEAVLDDLLAVYEPSPDAPPTTASDTTGTVASLIVHSTDEDPPWMHRWDVWVAESTGAVLLLDEKRGTSEAVSGLPAVVSSRLLADI